MVNPRSNAIGSDPKVMRSLVTVEQDIRTLHSSRFLLQFARCRRSEFYMSRQRFPSELSIRWSMPARVSLKWHVLFHIRESKKSVICLVSGGRDSEANIKFRKEVLPGGERSIRCTLKVSYDHPRFDKRHARPRHFSP